jgi:hypothetical protein
VLIGCGRLCCVSTRVAAAGTLGLAGLGLRLLLLGIQPAGPTGALGAYTD